MKLAPINGPTCGHYPIPGSIACPTCAAPEDWRDLALCRELDPEAFYPATYDPGPLTTVLATCEACPVQPYCLEEGWMDQHGIWGGWTAEARRQYRKSNRNLTRPLLRALGAQTRRS